MNGLIAATVIGALGLALAAKLAVNGYVLVPLVMLGVTLFIVEMLKDKD